MIRVFDSLHSHVGEVFGSDLFGFVTVRKVDAAHPLERRDDALDVRALLALDEEGRPTIRRATRLNRKTADIIERVLERVERYPPCVLAFPIELMPIRHEE